MPAHPSRRRGHRHLPGASLAATIGVGVATALAVVGWSDALRSRATPCLDAALCDSANAADFLPASTSALQLPANLLADGFRLLLSISLALGVLLIAIVALNVATLALSRSAGRSADFALRAALGAAPGRLAQTIGREAFAVVTAGVALGLVAGAAGSALLHARWPLDPPPWGPVATSLRGALLPTTGIVMVTLGCLFWPLRTTWRRGLRRFLPGNGQTTPGPVETLGRNLLVVVQTAAVLVLLTGAGLLLRPFGVSRGGPRAGPLDSADTAAATLVATLVSPRAADGGATSASGFDSPGRSRELLAILSRVRMVPGVTDSSLATEGAWAGVGVRDEVTALCLECWLGNLPKQYTTRSARIHAGSASALDVLGLSLRRGRWLSDEDDGDVEAVAVVSHAFALHFFPNGDPLNKEIRFGGMGGHWARVVGVVDDQAAPGLATGSQPDPAVYLSILQHPPATMSLLVETAEAEPVATGDAVRRAALAASPGVRVGGWSSLAELLERQRAPLRWFAVLFGVLAVLQASTAGWGLHALIAHGVRRRTRELGVRMALGAEGRQVRRLVASQSLKLALIGMVVGIIPLSGLARLLQLRVEGVDPWDPVLLLGIPCCLCLITLFASFGPARRAASLDPQVPLRDW